MDERSEFKEQVKNNMNKYMYLNWLRYWIGAVWIFKRLFGTDPILKDFFGLKAPELY